MNINLFVGTSLATHETECNTLKWTQMATVLVTRTREPKLKKIFLYYIFCVS